MAASDYDLNRLSAGKIGDVPTERQPPRYPDLNRLSTGKISDAPTERQPPSYPDMNRLSFGKIGDRPLDNSAFGPLSQPVPPAPVAPVQKSRSLSDWLSDKVMAKDMPGGGALFNTPNPTLYQAPDVLRKLSPEYARAAQESPEAAAAFLAQGSAPGEARGVTSNPNYGNEPNAPVHSAAEKPPRLADGYRVRDTSVKGVSRIDGGSSPLFTNLDPTQAAAEMKGNPVGIVPTGVDPFGSSRASAEVSAALQAAAARGDWDAVRSYYQKGGGTWQGRTAEQDAATGAKGGIIEWDKYVAEDRNNEARAKLMEALTTVQPGREGLSKNQASLLAQLLGTDQQNANHRADLALRAQQGLAQLGIQQGQLGVSQKQAENQGVASAMQAALAAHQLGQSGQLDQLRQQYLTAKTPAEQERIGQQYLLLSGKDPRQRHDEMAKIRSNLFGDAVKAASTGMMQGSDGKPMTLNDLLQQGERYVSGTAPTVPPEAAAIADRVKTGKMTREQGVAELKKLGME